MTIFNVTVERIYSIKEETQVEIEADTAGEARLLAVNLCENGDDDGDWSEKDGYDHSDFYEAVACEALATGDET